VAASISEGKGSLLFQALSLLKGAAFFFAIIMIVVTGFKVISAADADKSKKLVRGVLNVVAALAIMKVVDFVYYMASTENFAEQATDFILNVARFFGYIYGSVAVLMVFYAGYSFLTDGGGGDGMKRAKNILINLLVSGLVLFGFLLIL
jgi:type IV secretory pathway VirB2 component (pilin)